MDDAGLRGDGAKRARTARRATPARALWAPLVLAAAVLSVAGSAGPLAAQVEGERGAEAVRGAVQPVLDSLRLAAGAPGLSLGIVLPDGRTVGLTSGWADTARHVALTPDARMLLGSVGKTWFGATALQLVAEGALDLDAPVAAALGNPPWIDRLPTGRRITLRQLLGHTSGLVRYELNPRFLEDLTADPSRTFTPEERLAYLFDAEPPFAPGEGWDYSDTNYIVVAMLIERATGRSAYDEIRRRFVEPLGLDATVPSDSPTVPGLVQGYAGAGNPFGGFDAMLDGNGALRLNPQFEWGGGGWASTATDLARWTHAIHTGDVIPPALEEAYLAGTPAPLGPGGRYGLGVILLDLPAGAARGHSGMMPGYRTEAYHFPDAGFTLALQVNSSDAASLRVPPLRMLSTLAGAVAGSVAAARHP